MLSLLKGDCLEVMKTLPNKSIDCFVCDLPYGCLTGGVGKEKAKRRAITRYVDGEETTNTAVYNGGVIAGCAWDVKIDLVQFWEQVKRLARNDHTPVLMFCSTKFGAELIASNPKWFRYDLVWSKSNGVGFLSANKMPLRSHEMIYIFSKKGAYYKRIDIEGNFAGALPTDGVYPTHRRSAGVNTHPRVADSIVTREGIRCVKSVIEVANKKGKGQHPTAKPAELYEWLLERYCPEGGTMLDPTAGSFNSCWVAKKMGLKAIGIEKDPDFFWKAVARQAVS
jgi:site-specific DNA-methyltransferase (adenine-specific)